jgi:hypothetical protein
MLQAAVRLIKYASAGKMQEDRVVAQAGDCCCTSFTALARAPPPKPKDAPATKIALHPASAPARSSATSVLFSSQANSRFDACKEDLKNFGRQVTATSSHKHTMGVQKKTRKFATVKRVISQRDDRLKKNQPTPLDKQKKQSGKDELVRSM